MLSAKIMLLVLGSLLLLTSAAYKNNKLVLLSLFAGSFLVGCFFALLDPYLILWDEQFHALVAKHLTENPFKPMLYKDAVLAYDYKNWTTNYVWLHKQPLFLWQMALSIKLFGCTEFAVRLPSIIMHALLSLMVYKTGTLLFNKRIGLLGALLFSFAKYPLELVCGKYGTDHNDVAFMFYVTASLWALLEYKQTKNNKWLYLMGLFSGCAILVKWLVGLICFLCWATATFFEKGIDLKKELWAVAKALGITTLIALPWQLYILHTFPLESVHELGYNSQHMFTSVESHAGDALFYWNALNKYYGEGDLVPYLVLIAVVFGLYKIQRREARVIVITFIAAVYLFYSIAATKMTSYCIICAPFIFICIAASIQFLLDYLLAKIKSLVVERSVRWLVVTLLCFLFLNYNEVIFEHSVQKQHTGIARETDLYARDVIKDVSKKLGNNKYVVFNVDITPFGYIPFMFYTNYIAYAIIPTIENCETAKSKGYKIAVLKNKPLPDYIEKDSSIIKLNY